MTVDRFIVCGDEYIKIRDIVARIVLGDKNDSENLWSTLEVTHVISIEFLCLCYVSNIY